MQIAQSKTREQFPLSTKKIIKKTISSTIGYAVLFLALGIIIFFSLGTDGQQLFNSPSTMIVGLVGLLLIIFILEYIYQSWYFDVYFYDLTPDFIQIKKGVITPREITIPYERIQDVYVDQDLLDRIFGLYDVHLSSATAASGMEAHIDGVEKQSAEGLREVLLETVKQRIGKNRFTNSPAPVANPIS
jgi:membrane protein YdbS with pleckstrin-like domain